MRPMDADHAGLVAVAQAGDDRAREELIATYLPLLYNIVGRALSGHADVDDVVQETLLRVVRDLPALRAPESFRSWLVSITLRQISTHWHRQRAFTGRITVIDEARRIPDAGAEPEDMTILRLHVSDERRQVVEAGLWLDPDHRVLLSLWWQECAGSLSRDDIAAATGLTVAHVGVRLQRMREQLELSRTIVAALEASPRCPRLDETVAGWDGLRTSVWRKRIARHTRGCPVCGATTTGEDPAELPQGGAPFPRGLPDRGAWHNAFACEIPHRAIVRTARLFRYENASSEASTSWGTFPAAHAHHDVSAWQVPRLPPLTSPPLTSPPLTYPLKKAAPMTRHTHEPRATGTQERPPVLHRTRPATDQAVPADARTITAPRVTRAPRRETRRDS